MCVMCFQEENGVQRLVRSRGVGDVYKRREREGEGVRERGTSYRSYGRDEDVTEGKRFRSSCYGRRSTTCTATVFSKQDIGSKYCLRHTSHADDELRCCDLGGALSLQ